jgi:hypothetical protein
MTREQSREIATWRCAAKIALNWDYQRSLALEFERIANEIETLWKRDAERIISAEKEIGK